MMTYEEIKSSLDMLDDPAMKLEMVMDIGRTLVAPPADSNCDEIQGCASRVLICRRGNNFYGVADSALVRGIVAILISLVDGHSATEIKKMDLFGAFSALNINLGAGRVNGINSMIRFLQNL